MFKDCRTLEELKKKYHELVLKHHPDRGGDLETMKAINAEFDTANKGGNQIIDDAVLKININFI